MTFAALDALFLPPPKAEGRATGLGADGGSALVVQSPWKGQGSVF